MMMSNMQEIFKSLPMILTPKDVQIALGYDDKQINQVYRLFKSKKFPAEKVNGKYIIPKFRFLSWLGINEEGTQ